MLHLRVSVKRRLSIFCFAFAGFPWTKTNNRKQNKKNKKPSLRVGVHPTQKFLLSSKKEGQVEGKRAPATTSHSRSRNKSQDLGTIHVRMKHNKRNRNGTRKRPPLSNPWLKTRLLLCRISVHFLFLTPTVPHILSLHRTTDIKVCTACSYE